MKFFTTPRGYLTGLTAMLLIAVASLWVHSAFAHYGISPRAHANVSGSTSPGTVNVIDFQQISACESNPTTPGCEPKDQNHDGKVDTIDLQVAAQCAGTVSNEPCSNGYMHRDLIFDSTGYHDGCIPVPSNFDWLEHARFGDTADPGDDQLTGWGVVEWACNVTPVAGVTFHVQNLHTYAYANGDWDEVSTTLGWCVKSNVASDDAYSDISCAGGTFAMPQTGNPATNECETKEAHKQYLADQYENQCAIHWATPRVGLPSGTTCLATIGELKASANDTLLANFGSDWIDNGNVAGDSIVGRFRELTTDWRLYRSSSCSPTILQTDPPPL